MSACRLTPAALLGRGCRCPGFNSLLAGLQDRIKGLTRELRLRARQPSEKALRALAPKLGVTPLYLETGSDAGVCPHCERHAKGPIEKRAMP